MYEVKDGVKHLIPDKYRIPNHSIVVYDFFILNYVCDNNLIYYMVIGCLTYSRQSGQDRLCYQWYFKCNEYFNDTVYNM